MGKRSPEADLFEHARAQARARYRTAPRGQRQSAWLALRKATADALRAEMARLKRVASEGTAP